MISGGNAVCMLSGNQWGLAMAGSGLRLPGVGVAAGNYVSGATALIVLGGRLQVGTAGSPDSNYSGQAGRHLYVGSGGLLVAQALLVSGQSWNRMGVAISGGVYVMPDLTITSGAMGGPAGNY